MEAYAVISVASEVIGVAAQILLYGMVHDAAEKMRAEHVMGPLRSCLWMVVQCSAQ